MAVKFQHRILKRVRILLLRCQGSAIYFSAQTRGVGVCYWKSICTFLGNHLLWSFAVAFFFFLLLSMSSGDTTIRGSPQSQAGPRGAHSACFVLALNLSVGVGDYSKCFLLFLLLIACIALKKKKKQAMKARWLRRQHCEVNIFHGAERMVEK